MARSITRKIRIPTKEGGIDGLLVQPRQAAKEKQPVILWLHGGGYAVGMASMVHISRAKPLVEKYGATVLSVEYRLAGEHPYPAALEDAYAALLYVKAHCEAWGCDSSRIMVGGESAGGGLAAALCILARDRGEVNIAFQMPLYPMIDNRDTPSSRDNHNIAWNTARNHAAWALYLRKVEGEIPAYAAPARCEDLRGLPPCYTFVGTQEVFACEAQDYVKRLQEAGVRAKIDLYPTAFHAFDMLTPFRVISRRAAKAFEEAYLYAAEHDRAAQEK